jgi:hypothetical protein
MEGGKKLSVCVALIDLPYTIPYLELIALHCIIVDFYCCVLH